MADNNQLSTLLFKHINDRLTKQEGELLAGLLQNPENKEDLELILRESYEKSGELKYWDEPSKLAFSTKVLDAINKNEHTQTVAHRVRFLKTAWFRYAAAILIIACMGTYLFTSKKSRVISPATTVVQNIPAPSGNYAVLTLANGQKIILDSAQNGLLATQAGTNIQKTDKGEIIYNGTTNNKVIQYNELNVPRGSQMASLILSDGSKVYLNTESSIRYPVVFSETERKVEITGEAFFEIAKNARSTFIVVNGKMKTEVLGTSFNINGYKDDNEVKLTLIEGSVRVSSPLVNAVIKPGQEAKLTRNNKLVINGNADISLALAWQKGMFVFDNMDLSLILKQISRWYNIDVECPNDVSSRKFSGVLSRRSALTEFIKILQANGLTGSLQNAKLKVSMQ